MTALRAPPPFRLLVLLAGLFGAGCNGGEGPGTGSPAGYPERLDTAEVVLTLGRVEGPPEYLFGAVTSVAADARGRIYVADRIGSTVRVHAPDGAHLATLGGEGEGPGEYSWPADLAFGPEGRLYVRDARRITVLGPSGDAGTADSVLDTWRLPSRGNPYSRRSGVDSAGRYLHPGHRFPAEGGARYFYLVFEDGRHAGDTLPVPAYPGLERTRTAFYWLTEGRTGKMVHGLSRVPHRDLPRTLPALLDVVVARDGKIWVERWPPDGRPETRWYDVLRADGGYVRSVIVPVPVEDEPPPYITDDTLYGVVTDRSTGVQGVVAVSIRPAREPPPTGSAR